jgi:predicted ATPase/DNA-binding winged helix-turn-helix (wHTH) protein
LPLEFQLKALNSEAATAFAFGPFVLMPAQQQLLKNDEVVRMGGRALDLLTALVERAGEVLSKAELVAIAWPRLVVEEGNLKVNIFAIRRLLGDATSPQRYIETVAGIGYRFVAEVQSQTLRPARPGTLPSPTALPALDLPPLPASVFGRDEVVETLLLDLQQARLVSLVGPGGIGKTTVALCMAMACARAGAFDGGIRFVDLSVLEQAAQVPLRIAEALRGSPRPTLLVLDNCEHLIDPIATCADQLLTTHGHVKLIATSREPLSIRGEVVRRLRGLSVPTSLQPLSAEDALRSPAVQLFVARASESGIPFLVGDHNARAVVALCEQLDGHALAIERVARKAPGLGLSGAEAHVARRLHMLDSHTEGPLRHRTLSANVATSYELLSPQAQTALRRLALFNDGFSLAQACAVARDLEADPSAIVELVAQLVAKSLLLAEAGGGERRYRHLHIARSFLVEQLIDRGELEALQAWHAAHASACGPPGAFAPSPAGPCAASLARGYP